MARRGVEPMKELGHCSILTTKKGMHLSIRLVLFRINERDYYIENYC